MSADQRRDERRTAVDAAMGVASDVAEGRLSPLQLDAAAVEECRRLVGTVVGPDDPLWPLQCEVAQQVLAAGGIPANELQEWLAVQRAREPEAQLEVEDATPDAPSDPRNDVPPDEQGAAGVAAADHGVDELVGRPMMFDVRMLGRCRCGEPHCGGEHDLPTV